MTPRGKPERTGAVLIIPWARVNHAVVNRGRDLNWHLSCQLSCQLSTAVLTID
jgi:hypothetical protein